MTNIDPRHEAAREAHRQPGGEFGKQEHSAPETSLQSGSPLLSEIAEYVNQYEGAQEALVPIGYSGPHEDWAIKRWADFKLDNAEKAYEMLNAAKDRIDELERQLAQEQAKNAIPQELATAIEDDFAKISTEQPGLFVPQHGADNGDGYIDVVAIVDGETARKYTMTPEGDIDSYRL
ncbi:hypothetical protein [Microbacterium sp. 77mftsu3.1]|uniref:hypothetical protein n=1 Tax=Microbacterium sp. 77mftsu3.1 TaxID=1761802 RepID=UPI00037DBBFF|nr:hypothetical protein [Microbacterium sp. 77mftsu3.1]SDH35678.1 hypothetical protein SAMN04488590_3118 [Microbacterium sp. 77mftsu3.1]